MFLVIPLVEFLRVLGVDINVHHENPATFLCHVSVSSVKRSRHRFCLGSLAPSPHAWSPAETRDTNWGAISVNTENCIACKHTCQGGHPGYHVGAAARSRLNQGILGAENDVASPTWNSPLPFGGTLCQPAHVPACSSICEIREGLSPDIR